MTNAQNVQNARLQTAIIGAGFISEYHINGLAAAGGADSVVIVGRNPEKTRAQADRFKIASTATHYRDVLADTAIDAVVIATPDDTHRDMSIAALEAGKSVLLQKPMALTSEDCQAILEAEKTSSGRLTVSFMHRYFPEVRWLKSILEEGQLGDIQTVRIRNATPGADWADWFYSPGNVAGGVVMQLGVHGIDLCQHLMGPIDRVSAQSMIASPERRLSDGRVVTSALEDNVLAQYRIGSHTLISHEMSYTEKAGCDRFRLEIYAEKGTVWLRTERGPAALYAPGITGRDDWVVPDLEEEPLGQAHHRHWIDVAKGTQPPDDTGLAGFSSLLVAEAIYRAAEANRAVTLDQPDARKGDL